MPSDSCSFYTETHVPNAAVRQARARGIDVLTAVEAGLRTVSDGEHLAYATRLGRILVTRDRDFEALHYAHPDHAGIVLLTRDYSIGTLVEILQLIHAAATADELRGVLERM